MNYIQITNSSGTFDITDLVQSITWSGDYQQCSRTLEIEMVSSSKDKNFSGVKCELGNAVIFKQDDTKLFYGYIFEMQKESESSTIRLVCYDRGIYLKRNETTCSFSGKTPEAIAKIICSEFGIKVGSLAKTGIEISRNFVGVSLYSIIQTAYSLASEENGKHYIIRFKDDMMCVVEKMVTDETLLIEGGRNLISASTTASITNMVNQVAVYNNNDKHIATHKNDEAIKLYGRLQSCMQQNDKKKAADAAKKILSDNGVSQRISVDNLGNIANITGGTVVVEEPHTGVNGLFYIDSDVHTWRKGQYYNKLVLNFKSIMDKQTAGQLPNKNGNKTGSK